MRIRTGYDATRLPHGTFCTRSGIARFKYIKNQNVWKLYWMRADLKCHLYGVLPESKTIDKLVIEVDKDPHGAFFG
jgi:hypothetical protein